VHVGEAMVIAADLADFFPATPLRRVHGIFRSLGYPWAVARALTGLVSTSTPEAVFMRRPASEGHSFAKRKLHAVRHLPQGAPTSPALANLCAFGLDVRLAGLARVSGATYTRYADDLTFSGDAAFGKRAERVLAAVGRIAEEAGYRLNVKKTRVMPAHQRQVVTGVIVNAHSNVARNDYDALKAVLHNCVRYGAATQNRDGVADFRAHLDGRVHWVEQVNPLRGAKLRRLFEGIAWPLLFRADDELRHEGRCVFEGL
jgi:RNA-directed DNA polymerase